MSTAFPAAHPGDTHPAVAMPLGGIDTGCLSIGSDGGLRQWQIHHTGNHQGDLPGSFFALRVQRGEPTMSRTVLLQQARPSPPARRDVPGGRAPLVTDDLVPQWQEDLLSQHGGVASSAMSGIYPVARLHQDCGLGVDIDLTAWNPMVPTDTEISGVPCALFEFRLTNTADCAAQCWLAGSLHNGVGLDPSATPHGVRAPGYGSNTNTLEREPGWTRLVMDSHGCDRRHDSAGQMALLCEGQADALSQFQEPSELFHFLDRLPGWEHPGPVAALPGLPSEAPGAGGSWPGPSPAGQTWLGALSRKVALGPAGSKDASATVRFAVCWSFPNRYVTWPDFGPDRPEYGATRFWLGCHYTKAWPDARHVADAVTRMWDLWWKRTTDWTDAVESMPGSAVLKEHLAAQAVVPRTPTCFRDHEGRFFGFEGVLGASTAMWTGDVGYSCPLNCTHVWNYAQAASALWPSLEASMRDTEFEVMQAPDGSLPHRVIAPVWLEQLWDVEIGGPDHPALDGMLGAVLKTYREVRRGAVGAGWLRDRWNNLCRLMDHVAARWDPECSGLLTGEQPSTHDISLYGANMFMGSLWLAALRASEEMALILGATDRAMGWRERFVLSSAAYDTALFRGGYYVQAADETHGDDDEFGDGCLADQLIGQWWAHLLDLGHLLPAEHVRSALQAVVAHNLNPADETRHSQRAYAVRGEQGLVMCSWPRGGRPARATRYCDEVWTGCEYEVAALCLAEGLEKDGHRILDAIWRRHDGRIRNPYNEIECGDHYVRSMAGWSVLELGGAPRWDAISGSLRLTRPGSWPVLTGTGWGVCTCDESTARVTCHHGVLPIRQVMWERDSCGTARNVPAGETVAVIRGEDR